MLKMMKTNQTQRPVLKHGCLLFINIVSTILGVLMKILLLITSLLFSFEIMASEAYSVYLIRHAEKNLMHEDKKNPPLLKCGSRRAANLAILFKNIDLKSVYSSNFNRTKSTATPTAKSKSLEVELYDPYDLDNIFKIVKENKRDVLIVGHNSTTNVLAGKLAGVELPIIPENEYDRLYQVTIFPKGSKLQLIQQAFNCGTK